MSDSFKLVPCPYHPGYVGCCKPSVTVLPSTPVSFGPFVHVMDDGGPSGPDDYIVVVSKVIALRRELAEERAHADRLAKALQRLRGPLGGWRAKTAAEATEAHAALAAHEARRG